MSDSNGNGLNCCPWKHWRQIQTIIRTDNVKWFDRLCGTDCALHIARVLLSQRLSNENAMASTSIKYRILQLNSPLQPRHYAQQLFGSSCRDLDALQMAIFLQHEELARSMLGLLQHHVSRTELQQFVNHSWGDGNSSLHLAAFLGMENLVQLLLDCGADTTHRNTRQYNHLDGCTKPACMQLLQQPFYSPASTTINSNNNNNDHIIIKQPRQPQQHLPIASKEPSIVTTDLPRTSMLLKKAVQYSMARKGNEESTKANNLHLLLSTSTTSSTSSYSSLSSLEEPLSPSPSNQISDICENQLSWVSFTPPPPLLPPSPSPSPSKSPSRQYSYNDYSVNSRRISNKTLYLPSHMNQPLSLSYRQLRSSPPPPPSTSSSTLDDQDDCEIGENNSSTTAFTSTMNPEISFDNNASVQLSNPKIPPSPSPSKSVRFSPASILLDACMRGDIKDLMDLIKQHQQHQHAKPAAVLLQEWQDQQSTPVLSLTLLHQQEAMAKYLLSLGVDVNATDPDGWTPLHYAATLHLWSSVILLAHSPGVYLEARTNKGLEVYDCPRTMAGQRRCKLLIDCARKRHQQQNAEMQL